MADASEESDAPDPPDSDTECEEGEESVQTLRRQVKEKYDFLQRTFSGPGNDPTI